MLRACSTNFLQLPEGHLSRIRASFVNQQALCELALKLQMNDVIRLGEGEIKSGGYMRPSILADAFEAIVGGIFLTVILRKRRPLWLHSINP